MMKATRTAKQSEVDAFFRVKAPAVVPADPQATLIRDAIKRHVLVRAARTPSPCTHAILLNAHVQGNPCVDRAAATVAKRPNKGHACWDITCQLPMGAWLGIDE
ncbi:hypothetical protein [Burkholderia vietnamiensis]|uniref:hypothetical protein n=1 Tax=Burkholderia vietnamiensis TaxID=60552 RepID=UPI001CF4885A|nr:hypothetical protein [Burkholderia vietnamiensis]MCA8448940.1 hypothetical protein [Burkholderia vietnamiensis]